MSFLLYFRMLLMARTVLGLNQSRGKKYVLLQNVQMGSGAHTAFNSGGSYRDANRPSVRLTTYPHLIKKLRITGAMPLLPIRLHSTHIRTSRY